MYHLTIFDDDARASRTARTRGPILLLPLPFFVFFYRGAVSRENGNKAPTKNIYIYILIASARPF